MIFALFLLSSCGGGSSTKSKIDYKMIMKVAKINNSSINLTIKTNLPTKSTILVSVYREFYQKGNTEPNSGAIFNKDIEVSDDIIKIPIPINDKSWYNDFQQELKSDPKGAIFKPIDKISDTIFVFVTFSPRRQKNENVLTTIGKSGENLPDANPVRSEQSGFRTIDADTTILFQTSINE